MPSVRNHAGTRFSSKYSGRPELNPVKTQMSIRRVNSADHTDGRSVMRAVRLSRVDRCSAGHVVQAIDRQCAQ